jgi:hypothetical protein
MPKPSGNAPLVQLAPLLEVLATTPELQSFIPSWSLVPTATQVVAVGQSSDSMESPAGRDESLKVNPPSVVDRKVASIGVRLASADVPARPAQNPVEGQLSEYSLPSADGRGLIVKECPPSTVETKTGWLSSVAPAAHTSALEHVSGVVKSTPAGRGSTLQSSAPSLLT